jgi:hypothetical protein
MLLQDSVNKEAESLCHSQRLQVELVELQRALDTASSAADTRCKSAAAQMQMQLDTLTADHRSVQNCLKSQIVSLQQHIDCTNQQLQQAHLKLEEEKSARAAEVQSYRAELDNCRKLADAAASKEKSDQNVLKGQEQELQALHHQVIYSCAVISTSSISR